MIQRASPRACTRAYNILIIIITNCTHSLSLALFHAPENLVFTRVITIVQLALEARGGLAVELLRMLARLAGCWLRLLGGWLLVLELVQLVVQAAASGLLLRPGPAAAAAAATRRTRGRGRSRGGGGHSGQGVRVAGVVSQARRARGRRARRAGRGDGRVVVERALVVVVLVVGRHAVHRAAAAARVLPVHAVVLAVLLRLVAVLAVALVQLVHLELGRLGVGRAGGRGGRRAGQQPRDAERVVRGRVGGLLLEAAGHAGVVEGGRVGQEVRVQAAADHRRELVVRRAELGPQEAAYVRVLLVLLLVVLLVLLVVVLVLLLLLLLLVVRRGDEGVHLLVLLLLLLLVGLLLLLRGDLVLLVLLLLRLLGARVARLLLAGVVVVLVLGRLSVDLLLLVLEALLAAQVAAVLEHVAALRVQRPEAALARLVGRPGHLDEAVVEAERVPDGVLPALLVLPVEREQIHDELVDLGEREHLGRGVLYGHRYQADVAVRGLRVRVAPPVALVLPGPLQRGVGRVGLGQRERVPGVPGGHAGVGPGRQRPVAGQPAHAGGGAAHPGDGAPVPGHAAAAHGRGHAYGRAHGAHVEGPGRLGAAVHRHAHAAHRVDAAVRRRHAAHVRHGRGAAAHRAAEAGGRRLAVQLLRLEHCHRAEG